jgi:hypothetical protein
MVILAIVDLVGMHASVFDAQNMSDGLNRLKKCSPCGRLREG